MATNQDAELTLETYLAMTADIPWRWLALSVKRLMLQPSIYFAPKVGEIRHRAAIETVRSWRQSQGKDPDQQDNGQAVTVAPHHIDSWIGRGRQLEGLPAIPPAASEIAQLPEGWSARLGSIGARIGAGGQGDG